MDRQQEKQRSGYGETNKKQRKAEAHLTQGMDRLQGHRK